MAVDDKRRLQYLHAYTLNSCEPAAMWLSSGEFCVTSVSEVPHRVPCAALPQQMVSTETDFFIALRSPIARRSLHTSGLITNSMQADTSSSASAGGGSAHPLRLHTVT